MDLPAVRRTQSYTIDRDVYYAKYFGSGERGWPLGKKMKIKSSEKKIKMGKKTDENYIRNGENA